MFVEAIVNASGEILQGWCADTPPARPDELLFTNAGGDPAGTQRIRLDLGTVEALQIDEEAQGLAATAARAALDTGRIEEAARELSSWKRYRVPVLQALFRADMVHAIPSPRSMTPDGVTFRRATRARG